MNFTIKNYFKPKKNTLGDFQFFALKNMERKIDQNSQNSQKSPKFDF